MHFQEISDGLTIRVIRDELEWNANRNVWDELFASSRAASFALHFDWLTHWWQVYGAAYSSEGMRVVTVWRGTQCIGAAPLYLGHRTIGPVRVRELRLISTGEAEFEETCPNYMNFLCRTGEEAVCNGAVWRAVEGMPWDRVFLQGLPENCCVLRDHSYDRSAYRANVVPTGVCPVADLSRGFQQYLNCLSASTRRRVRRNLSDTKRNGVKFELATESNLEYFFAELIRLHQERWTNAGELGCFHSTRFTEFHRQLVHKWVPSGKAVLAGLSHANQMFGVLYGFVFRSKFYAYQVGLKRTNTGPIRSPGTALSVLLMATLAERCVTEFDFLQGSLSSYKQPFATDANQLVEFELWRPSLSSFAYRSARATKRAIQKAFRHVTPSKKADMGGAAPLDSSNQAIGLREDEPDV